MIYRVFNLIQYLSVYSIQKAGKHCLAGIPYDADDGSSNNEAHNGVCQRES